MKSIFLKTYIAIGLLLLVALIVTVNILDSFYERVYAAEFRNALETESNELVQRLALLPQSDWDALVDFYSDRVELDISLLSQSEVQMRWPELVLSNASPDKLFSKPQEDPWWLLAQIADTNYYLYLEELQSLQLPDLPLVESVQYIFPLLIINIIVAVGVLILATRISRPISNLSFVASEWGGGRLDVRADTHVPEPVKSLAIRFNAMASDLKRLITDQQILMGAIPHELRTPLSRIRFALDMTRKFDTVDGLREQIEVIDEYVDDLQSTIDEALAITRLGRTDAIRFERFDLSVVMQELLEVYHSNTAIKISLHMALQSKVVGNRHLIKRALGNVFTNAMKYTDSKVGISASVDAGCVVVHIDDDGPGVPEIKRREIFAPFSRLEDSRDRARGGVGLGLALVDMVMRNHRGTVLVTDSPLGGARFELRWSSAGLQHHVDPDVVDEVAH